MKTLGLLPGLMLVFALQLSAQVNVDVALEQEQFLPGEPLPTFVRISNHSGQTLQFGGEPDWLTFAVESREGYIVARNGEAPVLGEFILESSKIATKRVDLSPYFTLTRPGRYNIVASVRIKEWDGQATSPPKYFDVIRASDLWSREFGVPRASNVTHEPPEVRKYTLQQARYKNTQIRLYVRLTDASESKMFKVLPIGQMVSFSRPEPQVDSQSNLHLLYQNGPRSFNYAVINPDGDMIVRQRHDYNGDSRPRLLADAAGKWSVVGGVRKVMPTDIPAPKRMEDEPKAPTP